MRTAKIQTGDYVYVDSVTPRGIKYLARVLKSRIVEVQYKTRLTPPTYDVVGEGKIDCIVEFQNGTAQRCVAVDSGINREIAK